MLQSQSTSEENYFIEIPTTKHAQEQLKLACSVLHIHFRSSTSCSQSYCLFSVSLWHFVVYFFVLVLFLWYVAVIICQQCLPFQLDWCICVSYMLWWTRFYDNNKVKCFFCDCFWPSVWVFFCSCAYLCSNFELVIRCNMHTFTLFWTWELTQILCACRICIWVTNQWGSEIHKTIKF